MVKIRVLVPNTTHDNTYIIDGVEFTFTTKVGSITFKDDLITIVCFGSSHKYFPISENILSIYDEEIDRDFSNVKGIPLFGSLDFNKEKPALSSTSAKVHTFVNVIRDVLFDHDHEDIMKEIKFRLNNLALMDTRNK